MGSLALPINGRAAEDDDEGDNPAVPESTAVGAMARAVENGGLRRRLAALDVVRRPWVGVVLALAAGALFSLDSALMKRLTTELHMLEAIAVTGAVKVSGVIATGALLGMRPSEIFGSRRDWPALALPGAAYGGFLVLLYASIYLTSPADAIALSLTAPSITAVLGRLVLGDPFGWPSWLGLPVCFVAAMMVLNPPAIFGPGGPDGGWDARWSLGIAAGLTAAALFAIANVGIRSLGRADQTTSLSVLVWVMSFQCLCGAVAWGIAAAWRLQIGAIGRVGWLNGAAVVATSCASVMGDALTVRALKSVHSSLVVALESTEILWLVLLGWVCFGQAVSVMSAIGVVALIAGLVIMALERPPPEAPVADCVRRRNGDASDADEMGATQETVPLLL